MLAIALSDRTLTLKHGYRALIKEGTVQLSGPARALLRRRANGEHVEVTPGNLEAYRELANAGVMYPLSGFVVGPEAVFRFTEEGWKHRKELQRSPLIPSAMARRIFRALSLMKRKSANWRPNHIWR